MLADLVPRLPRQPFARSWAPGLLVWMAAWIAMVVLDGRFDLPNLALLLILGASVSALFLPPWASLLGCALAVLAFNVAFIPPRGRLSVDLADHVLLLAAMLVVSWIVALLMARLRHLAVRQQLLAQRADELRHVVLALRDSDDPQVLAAHLHTTLCAGRSDGAALLLRLPDEPEPTLQLGSANAEEHEGLLLCARLVQAMGPGTGRHDELASWYLPLRGRVGAYGAVLVRLRSPAAFPTGAAALEHAQALCDQLGWALERALALHAAARAREDAQAQALRNTLLASIAHDHRTPLATIIGAASALHDQAGRLGPEASQRLTRSILDEASRLSRLTENTLQLARLDAPGVTLRADWESAEELVGSAVRRVRQREPGLRVAMHVEADLPLLRCDAVLIVQALDNLLDNALNHAGDAAPIEVDARRVEARLCLAVRDRGPGVPEAARQRIFDVFQRGDAPPASAVRAKGAGVGLALCRSIARLHGGELTLRARRRGGSSFELCLPLPEPAQAPA